jgi:LemA protein
VIAVGAVLVVLGARKIKARHGTARAALALLEAELEHRRAVIPDLVRAAVEADLDRESINQLVGARSWSRVVQENDFDLPRRASAENALSVALYELIYSAHQANWEFRRPADELDVIEQRIVGAVRVYNTHADALVQLSRSPLTALSARLAGVHAPDLFADPIAPPHARARVAA